MKWLILLVVLLALAGIAWLLMRDPKKGGSVGIHGVSGKNKIGSEEEPETLEATDGESDEIETAGSKAEQDADRAEPAKAEPQP